MDGSWKLRVSNGFTLIELMVALTMLGVLLGIGIPSFTTMIRDNRITTESNRLISYLNYARSEASSRATSITLEHKSATAGNWADGWEIYTDTEVAGNTTRTGGDLFLKDTDASPNGVNLLSNSAGNSWISFQASGMLNEAGNTLIVAICDERGEASGRDVSVGLTGRISITAPSADCTP